MDIAQYVEQNRVRILETGKEAFQKLGRGALMVFPQRDNGYQRTEVRYLTKQMVIEDNDPTVPLVESYNPAEQAIIILCMDKPQSVLVYTVYPTEARLNVALSNW